MRAIIDNYDHISRLTVKEGIDIGPIPADVGLDRLRWNGSALIDLMDLSVIHVRRSDGRWFLHSVQVPGSQPVVMTFAERKRIIDDAGTYRVLSQAEWNAKLAEEQADISDNQGLKAQLVAMIKNTSYADLETRIDNIFSNLNGAQRGFLLQLSRIVLYLAKKELR